MPRKRNRRGFRSLPYKHGVSLGALANDTAVQQDFTQTFDDKVWAISCDLTFSVEGLTTGEGPISVGVAHSDYTAAEIAEWIDAAASWDAGDKIAQEKRRRKIRLAGTLGEQGTNLVLNDGKTVKVPLRFAIEEGETIALWAFNHSGATLTTGATVRAIGRVHVKQT